MLTRNEIERLAAAANALRPDWPVRSLCTWLQNDHAARAYRDVAVALAWIACDPTSVTPKRMNEIGPWWTAAKAAGTDATDLHFKRCQEPGHSSYSATNCSACRSEKYAVEVDADPTPVADISPEKAETYARGARRARAAIHDAQRGARP